LVLERTTLEKIIIVVLIFSQIFILSVYFLFPSSLSYTNSLFNLEAGAEIQAVTLSPNDQEFATGDVLGNISIYHVNRTLLSCWKGHNEEISSLRFSANGNVLVSGGFDGYVKLWNVTTRTNISEIYETGSITNVIDPQRSQRRLPTLRRGHPGTPTPLAGHRASPGYGLPGAACSGCCSRAHAPCLR